MSTHDPRNADMDRLLRAALKPPAQGDARECPEASLLAACVEGGLSKSEQAAIDAHVVKCGRCQETLASIGREVPVPKAAPARTRWFTWVTMPRLRWLVPVTAFATVAVFFFATRPLIAPGHPTASREAAQMAQATPPAEEPPAVAPAPVEQPAAGTAPAKVGVENSVRDRLASESQASRIPGARQQPEREERPADQAAAPVGMAQATPPPSAQAGQPVPETTHATGTAGKLARADLDARRAKAAADFAAAPPAAAPAQAEFALKSAAAPQAAAADETRPRAAALQKGAGLRSNETAFTVVAAPGSVVRWRLASEGRIWRSADAGETWWQQISGTSAALVAGSAPSPSTCWVVGVGGTVLLTLDGEHWERLPFPFQVDLEAVHAADARSAVVVARDGRRFQTADAGLTWR